MFVTNLYSIVTKVILFGRCAWVSSTRLVHFIALFKNLLQFGITLSIMATVAMRYAIGQ